MGYALIADGPIAHHQVANLEVGLQPTGVADGDEPARAGGGDVLHAVDGGRGSHPELADDPHQPALGLLDVKVGEEGRGSFKPLPARPRHHLAKEPRLEGDHYPEQRGQPRPSIGLSQVALVVARVQERFKGMFAGQVGEGHEIRIRSSPARSRDGFSPRGFWLRAVAW